MAYEVELDGALLQARYFSIDNESLIFKDTQMMCADVTGFAYGATVTTVHGINAKTEFAFSFIDSVGDTISFSFVNPHDMDLRGADVYNRMVDELWAAFGNRLYTQTVNKIITGATVRLEDTEFSKRGVLLRHKSLFGKVREVLVSWYEINAQLSSGFLFLRDPREPDAYNSFRIDTVYNAHVILRLFQKIGEDHSFINVLTG